MTSESHYIDRLSELVTVRIHFSPIFIGGSALEFRVELQNVANVRVKCLVNPYPRFFGTITERHLWKKIQNRHWCRHS